jgi:hypothetical protein
VLKNKVLKKINMKTHISMPHMEMDQTNSKLELSNGQLMKP